MRFENREKAGQQLAEQLEDYKNKEVIIYALPRGGVVIGAEIANKLHKPLDIIVPRKIGHPLNKEYAIGVVSENGTVICNEREVQHIDKKWLERAISEQVAEARRRRLLYTTSNEIPDAEGKIAIITDDGVATGFTMLAAVKDVQQKKPRKLIVAVPVSSSEAYEMIMDEVDEVITLQDPKLFIGAVSAYYIDFPQIEDAEVIEILHQSYTTKN